MDKSDSEEEMKEPELNVIKPEERSVSNNVPPW